MVTKETLNKVEEQQRVSNVKADPKNVNPKYVEIVNQIIKDDKELLERLANA
ncbi:MAG: hypothetical protein QM571_01445 [Micrococcaceae bacterium]